MLRSRNGVDTYPKVRKVNQETENKQCGTLSFLDLDLKNPTHKKVFSWLIELPVNYTMQNNSHFYTPRYNLCFAKSSAYVLILISSSIFNPQLVHHVFLFKTCQLDIMHFLIDPTSEGWGPFRAPDWSLFPSHATFSLIVLSSVSWLWISHSAFPSLLHNILFKGRLGQLLHGSKPFNDFMPNDG